MPQEQLSGQPLSPVIAAPVESRAASSRAGTAAPIALFVPTLGASGAERVAVNLARGLIKAGRSVDLVVARAEGALKYELPAELRLVDLEAARVLFSLVALTRYLRRERPAALIGFMDHANIIALWARRLGSPSTRVIATVHNTMSVATRRPHNQRSRLMPSLVQFFYPWADKIVAVSHGAATDLIRKTGLPADRVDVIYNPVVTPELLAAKGAPVPHPWLEPGQPPVIMGVGRLTGQKDFATLLRAFALVRRRMEARLMIVGEGRDRPALEALVQELGIGNDVSLPGFQLRIHAFIVRSSVFVLSSAWEGLPTVLIEALALGREVVATDCPSGPREILQGGRLGQLVPVKDPEAMSRAIVHALEHPRPPAPVETLGAYTEASAVEHYLRAIGQPENG